MIVPYGFFSNFDWKGERSLDGGGFSALWRARAATSRGSVNGEHGNAGDWVDNREELRGRSSRFCTTVSELSESGYKAGVASCWLSWTILNSSALFNCLTARGRECGEVRMLRQPLCRVGKTFSAMRHLLISFGEYNT